MKLKLLSLAAFAAFIPASQAAMVITEWMYSGDDGEYIEFTNTGDTAIDLTGWSYDDDSETPGGFDLSAFGVVQPGQSVIITEADAADFIAAWSLDSSVLVLGGYTNSLGRNDEINLYDGTTLVDQLTFGDEDFAGSIRTQGVSGVTDPSNYGTNDVASWYLSSETDGISWTSANGDVGSPGVAVVPEPTVSLLSGLAISFLAFGRKRRA
ncbi:lamin tail domain-containing protein [Luteolibacter pohnpeiensis]|uniref:Lamin tail domain-containing protein n=1 Tax=Luteolibacter pohnpeiensis TaxID=454153 RepID=A0A934S344_9BACT|nr:lamin tail domain-containing protein [Luteolibacter pohnpeiensis]MBK1881576.1 lamin tail domain-containing protein [Luteolibacter pohnpeiensis]